MNLSDLIPPSDLLDKIRGVEAGLLQRRRLGRLAWLVSGLLAALQISVLITSSPLADALSPDKLAKNWLVLLPLFLVVASLVAAVWFTFWLKESEQPFRYSCSLGAFDPETKSEDPTRKDVDERMKWLTADLEQLLNQRVQRFRFVAEAGSAADADKASRNLDAHVHVHGRYVVRDSADVDGELEVQVYPAIRIGPPGTPETLAAPPMPLVLRDDKGNRGLPRARYDDLLETVFHSVVTEIYRQLKSDVERKIGLLPTRALSTRAYVNEADDYARANSFQALDQARELYGAAAELLDPAWNALPAGGWFRFVARLRRWVLRWRAAVRRFEARWRPAACAPDLMLARAATGYSLTLSFQSALGAIQGRRVRSMYEAPVRARGAVELLDCVPEHVPGWREVRFAALVAEATARAHLGDEAAARELLQLAEQLDAARAARDAHFLFAAGVAALERPARLAFLRRAVEISPRFEAAVFLLARELESHWRANIEDRAAAAIVIDAYRDLIRLNPQTAGAWANMGYVAWLLEQGSDPKMPLCASAESSFLNGLKVKPQQREVLVGELHYGLARLYAERGDIPSAYKHLRAATADMFSQAVVGMETDFRGYYFGGISEGVRARFERYVSRFEAATAAHAAAGTSAGEAAASVSAFVRNDWGEALKHAYWAADDDNLKSQAEEAFQTALGHDPHWVLSHSNLADLSYFDPQARLKHLRSALDLEPRWSACDLELARGHAELARNARRECESLTGELEEMRAERKGKNQDLTSLQRQLADAHVQRDQGTSSSPPTSAPSSDTDGVMPYQRQLVDARGAAGDIQIQQRIKTVRAELAALERKIDDHDQSLRQAQRSVESNTRRAASIAEKYLPHRWLWLEASGAPRQFAWGRLHDRDHPLRWERELTQLQVAALYAWVDHLTPSEFDAPTLTSQPVRRLVELLRLLQAKFLPGDPPLLQLLARLDPDAPQAQKDIDRSRHVEAVQRQLEENPHGLPELDDLYSLELGADEERRYFARARASAPHNTEVQQLFAQALVRQAKQQKGDDALELYREATGVASNDPESFARLAEQLMATDPVPPPHLAEAKEAIDEAVRLAPESSDYRLRQRRLAARISAGGQRERAAKVLGSMGEDPRVLPPRIAIHLTGAAVELSGARHKERREQALQQLRDGMYWELGVYFPTPEFRASAAQGTPSGYEIRFDNVIVVAHELPLDRWFLAVPPATLEANGIDAEPVLNPANGNPASWVRLANWPKAKSFAEAQNLFYRDSIGLIVLHLAAIMRMNAAELIDIDDVAELLRERGLTDELHRLTESGRLALFAAVVRGLVAEQFPVLDIDTLLAIFDEQTARLVPSAHYIVEAVRCDERLRDSNPFLRESHGFIRIGPRFAKALEVGLLRGDSVALALDPVVTQDLLKAVRDAIDAIVARVQFPVLLAPSELRPWLRRLIEIEFPHFHVVAEAEVVPTHEHRVRGRLDLGTGVAWDE